LRLLKSLFGQATPADVSPGIKVKASDIHCEQGMAHLQRSEYGLAVAAFTEAIRLDPTHVGAYRGRWVAYCSLEDDANAAADQRRVQDLQQLSDTDPKPGQRTVPLVRQGNSYEYQDEWDKAMDCYSEAIRLDPQYVSAYIYRALLHDKMGNLVAA